MNGTPLLVAPAVVFAEDEDPFVEDVAEDARRTYISAILTWSSPTLSGATASPGAAMASVALSPSSANTVGGLSRVTNDPRMSSVLSSPAQKVTS